MTRAERRELLLDVLGYGASVGCFVLAWSLDGSLLVPWLGRLVLILLILLGIKRTIQDKDYVLLIFMILFLYPMFSGPVFAAMIGFIAFFTTPLLMIGHALLVPVNYLLKNYTIWRGYK